MSVTSAFVGNGQVKGVQLESGEVLQADLLIAATGIKPNLKPLEGSGIAHNWGITVDEHLRTNAADVYAVIAQPQHGRCEFLGKLGRRQNDSDVAAEVILIWFIPTKVLKDCLARILIVAA